MKKFKFQIVMNFRHKIWGVQGRTLLNISPIGVPETVLGPKIFFALFKSNSKRKLFNIRDCFEKLFCKFVVIEPEKIPGKALN